MSLSLCGYCQHNADGDCHGEYHFNRAKPGEPVCLTHKRGLHPEEQCARFVADALNLMDFLSMAVEMHFLAQEKLAMLEVKSYPQQREVVPVEVDLVFDDWKRMGKPVEREEYIALSEHEFHGGTTFPGIILLDAGNAAELRERLAQGLQPSFWMSERPSSAKAMAGELPAVAGTSEAQND